MRSDKVPISRSAIVGLAVLVAGTYLLSNGGATSPRIAQAAEPQPFPQNLVRTAPAPVQEPGGFECGYQSHEQVLQDMRAAVAAGEITDPALRVLPRVTPRRTRPRGTVRGGGVPTVTQADIFLFEDTAGLLLTNYSNGQRNNLMAQATNALLVAEGDSFDFVGFFLNFTPHHQFGSAFYLSLENDVTGIGSAIFNNRPFLGVAGDNVEGWVTMWNQASWFPGTTNFTALVLGQEFEHRFGMRLSPFLDGRVLQGTAGCGRTAHWNFRVDAQGSGMEVSEWVGASPATLACVNNCINTDIGGVFSYPDLYLMGYVSGAEMDAGASELRYMNDSCGSPYAGPISAWTSADIVAANGARVPDSTAAQKDFTTGWIMIHQPGSPPTSPQLNNVVAILNDWSFVYNFGTLGLGTMDNTLFRDCNNNGISDSDDVAAGTSADCNANVMPDECEPNEDCNGNGVQDICDIAAGTSEDCNTNGIPDECDIAGGTSADSDSNSVPDECEPIFAQIDQCAPFLDSYEGSLGFLVDQLFNCNADATCITGVDDPFVLSGQQHLYWFDRVRGDGRLINTLDFKYHSSVAGPHVVRVQIRDNVLGTSDAGTLIPGGSYEMIVPGSIHLGEAFERTDYFVRMFFPDAAAIACSAQPSYIVGELDAFNSPVDRALNHVLPASIVQTFTSWTPVQSGTDQFTSGVGVSMNASGTGWFQASEDYFGAGDDIFLLLDKDGERWETALGFQLGSLFFGGKSCDGPNDGPGGGGGTGAGSAPEASMYLKLWGESDCNGNGIPDECELDANDCNNNLVPDDCEPTDTDGDMVADICEECPNEPALLVPSEPGAELTCDDLIDNDCDGLTDGADPDCATVCLFTDDFERATGNTVGNGWVEAGGNPSAIAVAFDGTDTYCKMERNNVSITQSGIDMTGLTNVSFDYDWRDNGATEAPDSLIVQWKPSADASFITLATHVLTQATFLSESQALPVEAENTTIDIRFLTSVSSNAEGAHVDNVVVCGAALCADGDGDGSCDTDDGCPADPNKTAPGQCGCGNSDTDTDGDGTADCNDGCPIDPNKTAPGVCGCGVVEDLTDTDGDATPDCLDACPNDSAKTDPGICGCGTPDTDTDGDGTPDCLDACPNEPALVNPSEPGTELTCNDTVDNDCDGLTDAADPDCTAGCTFACGDINGSGGNADLVDFAAFALCFGKSGPGGACPDPVTFACSDLDANGATNLLDFATFTLVFGASSTNAPPNCP